MAEVQGAVDYRGGIGSRRPSRVPACAVGRVVAAVTAPRPGGWCVDADDGGFGGADDERAQGDSSQDSVAPVCSRRSHIVCGVGRALNVGMVSHEAPAVAAMVEALGEQPGVQVFRGMGAANRFKVPGWTLARNQLPQFGDLRLEAPGVCVVVEFESAGTVGNLVKYWPLLAAGFGRRLVIVQVYRVATDGDYLAHRLLWRFLVERMTEDLEARGVNRPDRWEAAAFTYRPDAPAHDAAQYVRAAVARI